MPAFTRGLLYITLTALLPAAGLISFPCLGQPVALKDILKRHHASKPVSESRSESVSDPVIEVRIGDLSAQFNKKELEDGDLVRSRLGFPHLTHAQHRNMKIPLADWYQNRFSRVVFVITMSLQDENVHKLDVHWRRGNGDKGFRIATYDFTKVLGESVVTVSDPVPMPVPTALMK